MTNEPTANKEAVHNEQKKLARYASIISTIPAATLAFIMANEDLGKGYKNFFYGLADSSSQLDSILPKSVSGNLGTITGTGADALALTATLLTSTTLVAGALAKLKFNLGCSLVFGLYNGTNDAGKYTYAAIGNVICGGSSFLGKTTDKMAKTLLGETTAKGFYNGLCDLSEHIAKLPPQTLKNSAKQMSDIIKKVGKGKEDFDKWSKDFAHNRWESLVKSSKAAASTTIHRPGK